MPNAMMHTAVPITPLRNLTTVKARKLHVFVRDCVNRKLNGRLNLSSDKVDVMTKRSLMTSLDLPACTNGWQSCCSTHPHSAPEFNQSADTSYQITTRWAMKPQCPWQMQHLANLTSTNFTQLQLTVIHLSVSQQCSAVRSGWSSARTPNKVIKGLNLTAGIIKFELTRDLLAGDALSIFDTTAKDSTVSPGETGVSFESCLDAAAHFPHSSCIKGSIRPYKYLLPSAYLVPFYCITNYLGPY